MKGSFKLYIRGFGAGLIVAAVLMAIAGNIKKANDKYSVTSPQETSTASALAYVTTQSETKETSIDADRENSNSESAADENAKETVKETTKETTAAVTPTEERTTVQAQTEKAAGVNPDGSVTVNIKNVYYSSQAADILYNAGVITDKQAFNDYMYTSGYATKIKEGTYDLKPGTSYETIAKTITKTK